MWMFLCLPSSVTLICACQGLAFDPLILVTPRNLDVLCNRSGRSAVTCSRSNATAPCTPSASSSAHSARYSATGKFVFALARPSLAMLTRS